MIYQINKITAAGCQIDTAIELILSERDDVSACVLIHSAWSIVKDINIHKGVRGSRDWAVDSFPKEKPKAIWEVLDSNWTFFKHAKDDPNGSLDFDCGYLETALMLVINDFGQLSVQSTSMDVYQLWFISKYKGEFFTGDKLKKTVAISNSLFPDLESKSLTEQRSIGLKEINKQILEQLTKQSA